MGRICFDGENCITGTPLPPVGLPPTYTQPVTTNPSKPGSGDTNTPPYKWHPLQPKEEFREIGIYPEILTDVSILEAIHHASKGITDDVMRDAVHVGTTAALDSLRKRTAKKVTAIHADFS